MNKKLAISLVVSSLVAVCVFAADVVVDNKSVGTATYTLTSDGTDMTLDTDKITATTVTATTLAPTTVNATTVNATTVAGTTVGAVSADVSGALTLDATSQNVTNNQIVTLSKSVYILNGIGGANDTTNTVVLGNVAPAMVGAKVTLVVAAATTNLITIADSAPGYLGAAFVGDGTDTLDLYVVATNVIVKLSTSDN